MAISSKKSNADKIALWRQAESTIAKSIYPKGRAQCFCRFRKRQNPLPSQPNKTLPKSILKHPKINRLDK